jgi:methionine biosynthesis protein MetW
MKISALRYYLGRIPAVLRVLFGDFYPDIGRMDYDEYWETRGEFSYSTRYSAFEKLIEPGSSVLDIGCGDGATLSYLARKLTIRGEGLDVSGTAVRRANERGVKARGGDAASDSFIIDPGQDYIIISEVLEHIPNPEDLLSKTRGKFKKGLILSVPNTGHYLHRLRLLFGRFPVQWAHHPGEHLRFWTLGDFKFWLEWQGFSPVDMRVHSGVPLLNRIVPSLFADSAVFLVKEAPEGIPENPRGFRGGQLK